ncbi:hypothetical protein SIN8267_02066 [Sinobacterium norvegicum]|uniref:VOC domain-containing protein n=1 Tax=Sinobacterium norvegicum TaxID=1641715 RepID=A0ABM9AFG7_9GAMM|nr:VOC family protein [Sinobacterium norvegicum]CAH0991951.1 hypothetical protein SIN8267_02066 [Sinobacterium norvegicum]
MVSVGQFCINVSDLEKSIEFYSDILGLTVEHRIQIPGVDEAVLVGDDGIAKIQISKQLEQTGPIEHSNAFWKLYMFTDDCAALYQKAVDYGCESVQTPIVLDEWKVTMGFVKDPDGYLVEILQRH